MHLGFTICRLVVKVRPSVLSFLVLKGFFAMCDLKKLADWFQDRKCHPARSSAWERGVNEYALELIDELKERLEYSGQKFEGSWKLRKKLLLNGAANWSDYSYAGCSLIHDVDIAQRLLNPTQLNRVNNGEKMPNEFETWLDVQERALWQAARLILCQSEPAKM